jgi:competence protein ComEA
MSSRQPPSSHAAAPALRRLAVALALAGTMPTWAADVDANSGNRAQLEQLRGIGPPLADRILVERERAGAFRDWRDLIARVRGVRDAKARQLSDAGLTVAGAHFESAASAP